MSISYERLFVMKPELLAPANLRTLTAAVQAGADAVYLGGTSFGARRFAENFDPMEMEKAVDYCHLRGVKVYLASNILIPDSETGDFLSFITDAYNIGVDAFIIQDMGMAKLIKDRLPDACLHASTQMTVHNTEGAAFLKELGFKRVVTARELSKKDIAEIAEKSGIEVEIFVHGAICMSYSGQCLMSSMIGGRSGNRGSCAQPCRLPYELSCGGKTFGKGYFLSPRDLSLAGNMKDILKTGVTSLKIEGRMKGPEYVAAAVSVLRKLIDEERNCSPEELKMLENAFSRDGFTSGMFTGDVDRYINSKSGNDDIYKKRDESVLKELKKFAEQEANLKRLPVSFEVKAVKNEPFKVIARAEGFEAFAVGEKVQQAQSKPTDEKTIEKQIAKTGDYPFFASEIKIETDGESFLPLSDINGLRRECLDRLQQLIVLAHKKNETCKNYLPEKPEKREKTMQLAVMVTNRGQLSAARKSGINRIFVPCGLETTEQETAVFPDIIHNDHIDKYLKLLEKTEAETVCSANYAVIKHALKLGKKVVTSAALNVFGSESIKFWENAGVSEIVLSQELNLKQIGKIKSDVPLGAIVYGKTVMMKTAVCPVKAAMKKCGGEKCSAYLKDRRNEKFPVICNGMTTFVLNAKPIYMADKLTDLEKAGISTALIHFTNEPESECRQIIDAYLNGKAPETDFTRGHFYRGVT